MNWFKKHPNWAIFFVWVIAFAFFNVMRVTPIEANSNIWFVIAAITVGMVWGILAWSLKIKHRSYFNLFYLLIPFIGMIIVWAIGSKGGTQRGETLKNI